MNITTPVFLVGHKRNTFAQSEGSILKIPVPAGSASATDTALGRTGKRGRVT